MPNYSWPEMNQRRHIGKSPKRLDGPAKSSGRAKYPSDLNPPGLIHAVMLTSPHAHARVKSIDVSAASIDSSVVKGGQPVNTGAPTISGTARRTSTLASMAGVWGGIENDYAYQWQRRVNGSFADIPGATATTYTLGSADVGTVVRLRVTATNVEGAVSAVSAATATVAAAPPRNTGLPTVTGAARLNETLTARSRSAMPDTTTRTAPKATSPASATRAAWSSA